jgi:hypothetical protein
MDKTTTSTRMEAPARLLGTWRFSGDFGPGAISTGTATFEWLPGHRFILMRWTFDGGDLPDGVAMIGADAAGEGHLLHVFDSRGIARVYWMDFEYGRVSLERTVGDFSPLVVAQRFHGAFSADGERIEGTWEQSHDGSEWERDLAITFTRGH